MIWIIVIAVIVVLAGVFYLPGLFIHKITYTAVTVSNRKTDETFALTLLPEVVKLWLPDFKDLHWIEGSLTEPGSKGKLILSRASINIKVTQFVPNYRWAFKCQFAGIDANVQLSFYRTGTSETRVVLIILATSTPSYRRTVLALGKNGTQKNLEKLLGKMAEAIDASKISPQVFEDTSAEENPNFSLQNIV
jgi:hypothetical protein